MTCDSYNLCSCYVKDGLLSNIPYGMILPDAENEVKGVYGPIGIKTRAYDY